MLSEGAVDRTGVSGRKAEAHYVPNADEISLETVINLLVSKKIVTADELFSTESQVREYRQYKNDVSYVNIKNNFDRGKFPKLKKAMSMHRWSRHLGSFLFGWKWKKVKSNHASHY
ncbi:hypothetical protein JXB12_01550 [candidate division KSB1 bacterium]|nr:hypothetical protein [candidate division KSB1 bacterium]